MNGLLTSSIIEKFDYATIKKKIVTFISAIDLLLFRLKSLEEPKVTSNYEIKYNCFVPVTSSKLENFVINKIYLEDEIKEIISKYMLAVNALNKIERAVFIKTYIYEDKDDVICYDLGISMKSLLKTKKSASIKFSSILDLDGI